MGRPDTEPVEAELAMYRGPSNTEAALLARNALECVNSYWVLLQASLGFAK